MQHVLQREIAHLHENEHGRRVEEVEEEERDERDDKEGADEGADEGAGLGFEAGAVVEGLAAVSSREQMDEMIGDLTMRDHRMSIQDQGEELGFSFTVNATLRDSFDSTLMSADGMSVSCMSANGPWCCT